MVRSESNPPLALPEIGTLHGVFAQARVQPETITIFNGWSRLTTDIHGEMDGGAMQGFFCAETRFLTMYQIAVNGKRVRHRLSVQLSADEWSTTGAIVKSGDSGNLPEGRLPKGAIEVRLLRKCAKGLSERIFVKNNGVPKRKIHLEIRLACPILDSEFSEEMKTDKGAPIRGVRPRLFERGGALVLHFERCFGKRRKTPTRELELTYGVRAPRDGTFLRRGLEIRVSPGKGGPPCKLRVLGGRQPSIHAWAVLGPREELCLELAYEPIIDGLRMPAPELGGLLSVPRVKPAVPEENLRIVSGNSTFNLIVGQAMSDLLDLKLPVFGESILDNPERYAGFIAGVPRYIGLFGRDTVITGWQGILFDPRLLEPALSRVELFQGIRYDSWRDEEPDRMLHERRLDPAAQVGKLNRNLYYGDVTSTPFWILALSSLYQWTGDRNLILRHLDTLERCCHWILRRLHEGDGLIFYAPDMPRFGDENRNQAWKDSGDAIVDEHGRIRTPPLAVAEVQGYAYQALYQAADLLDGMNGGINGANSTLDRELLRSTARRLKEKFNQAFWLPEERFYALALDGDRNPLRARASNIGHCLNNGILEEQRVEVVVRGLMEPDLFSGWGIRTLSSANPGFDPFSYHRGSVWPVENAIIADGMALNGYREESHRVITAQLALAATLQHMRLPEVFAGQARSALNPVPGIYSYANLLQAWSVSAISQFVQTLLGIRPRADRGILYLDPALPEWLSWVELENLKVGTSRLKLRFERGADGRSTWNVLDCQGPIRVMRAPESAGREMRAGELG